MNIPDVATDPFLGQVMGAMTVLFLACFAGWASWAWLPSNRANMDAAARLPLED
jgi:cbb3-type cytochrome oxidase subunit 3